MREAIAESTRAELVPTPETPMIGLDTNILVRYLTQDDPIQSPTATDIIEFRLSQKNSQGLSSIVAMVERVPSMSTCLSDVAAAGTAAVTVSTLDLAGVAERVDLHHYDRS